MNYKNKMIFTVLVASVSVFTISASDGSEVSTWLNGLTEFSFKGQNLPLCAPVQLQRQGSNVSDLTIIPVLQVPVQLQREESNVSALAGEAKKKRLCYACLSNGVACRKCKS